MYTSYICVKTIEEATEFLNINQKNSAIIAGGTDLMIQLRNDLINCEYIIDITKINQLKGINCDGANVSIGSTVTFAEIMESSLLEKESDLLINACRQIGAVQIRNMGTIGGNICTASGAADLIPCLIALDAQIVLVNIEGERKISINDFIVDNRRTTIKPNELLKEVIIPRLPASSTTEFIKFGQRKSQAISIINIAVLFDYELDYISNAKIVVGCAGPKAILCKEAPSILRGEVPSEKLFKKAGKSVINEIFPIDDIRASAEFRNHLATTLVTKALTMANNKRSIQGSKGII